MFYNDIIKYIYIATLRKLMDPFILGLIVLFAMSVIFYIVSFTFIYYWHLVKISVVVVPALWTFEFFSVGFLIVALVSILINYLPILVRLLSL